MWLTFDTHGVVGHESVDVGASLELRERDDDDLVVALVLGVGLLRIREADDGLVVESFGAIDLPLSLGLELSHPEGIGDDDGLRFARLTTRARLLVPSGALPFERLREGIVIDRLTFSYPGGRTALRDLSLRFAARRRTWVVGTSGSGKSTVLKLLVRLYDCAPRAIRLDGVDLRELSTASLLSRLAWAPSDPYFLDDTVRANLTYGLERASDDDIWRLAEALAISDLVRELPAGLDTDLGERGLVLSSGERQRLALARAVLATVPG